MLTSEEKKKIKDEIRKRENLSNVLIDNEGCEIANMIFKGLDFPWTYGELKPLEFYSKYSEIFEKVRYLTNLEEEAYENGNDELADKYTNEVMDMLDNINDMGFSVFPWQKQTIIIKFIFVYSVN